MRESVSRAQLRRKEHLPVFAVTRSDTLPAIAFTRSEALNLARTHYRLLIERARNVTNDHEYVERLGAEWDRELARLAGLGSALIVRSETFETVARLIERSGNPSAPADVVIEWLDAFPDSIADLFPPSAATYRLVAAGAPATAETRQPARALAA
jgi:hypothetical protein